MSHLKKFLSHLIAFFTSTAGKITLGVVSLAVTAVALYQAWPMLGTFGSFISHANLVLVLASVATFSLASFGKAWDWQQMFAGKRPSLLACAGASGLAGIFGLALPGEIGDVVRIESLHKAEGDALTDTTVALATSGMLDPAAMAPFAIFVAVAVSMSAFVQVALIVYGILGLALAALVIFLPKMLAHPKLAKVKFIAKMSKAWATRIAVLRAYGAAMVAFLLRSVALLLLLKAVSAGGSFELMLAMQCIGAVMSVVPIGAAGSAGASVVLLTSAGVASGTAVSFSIAAQLASVAGGFVFVPILIGQLIVKKFGAQRGTNSGTTAGKQ